jgi:hypothetical protein
MENIELSNCVYDVASGNTLDVSLRDTCYEHIKDTFYYGLFGDFKLVIDTKTGYFNATKLCDAGGKNYRNWSRLEKSKNMVEYYSKSCRSDLSGSFLYEIKLQNNDDLNKQITGTSHTSVPQKYGSSIVPSLPVEMFLRCQSAVAKGVKRGLINGL